MKKKPTSLIYYHPRLENSYIMSKIDKLKAHVRSMFHQNVKNTKHTFLPDIEAFKIKVAFNINFDDLINLKFHYKFIL